MSGEDGFARKPPGRYHSEENKKYGGDNHDNYNDYGARGEGCGNVDGDQDMYGHRVRGRRSNDNDDGFCRGDNGKRNKGYSTRTNSAYKGGSGRFGDLDHRENYCDNYETDDIVKDYGNDKGDGPYLRGDGQKSDYDSKNYGPGGNFDRSSYGGGYQGRDHYSSRNHGQNSRGDGHRNEFEDRGDSGQRGRHRGHYDNGRDEPHGYHKQTYNGDPQDYDEGRRKPFEDSYDDVYGDNQRFGGRDDGDFKRQGWDSNRDDRGFSRGRGGGRRGRMIRGSSAGDEEGERFGGFSNRDKSSKGCFKCGGPHMARECTETAPAFGGAAGDGRRKPVTYIPEEIPVDEEQFSSVSKGINFNNYENIPVEVTGNDPPKQINSFEECDIEHQLKKNVAHAKYDKPTPIQKWAIPIVLNGRDLMGCAQTGSGKTAGFLLPILSGILRDRPQGDPLGPAPLALIVGPTRELVTQIHEETRKFSIGTNIRSVVVYGGVSVAHQIGKLRDGVDIVIATVGRLMDFVHRGIISLKRVRYLILDEADRMLDLGFKTDILSICFDLGMPPNAERQTLLFSATFPEEIQQIAATILNDYIFVAVGIVGGANHDIEQVLELVPLDKKKERLIEILESQPEETKTIVFVEKKVMSDFLAVILCQNGLRSTSIHGDREQREREEALKTLKSGDTPIIVATSVAARGLDIPGIGHVINYDLPKAIDDYVHRIGRTGRCGNIGKATSFYDPDSDAPLAQDLQNILAEAQQEIPLWLLDYCHSSSDYQSSHCAKDVRYDGKKGSHRGNRFGDNDRNEDQYSHRNKEDDEAQNWN